MLALSTNSANPLFSPIVAGVPVVINWGVGNTLSASLENGKLMATSETQAASALNLGIM